MYQQPVMKKFEDECHLFKLDINAASRETSNRIKKESKNITVFVKFHLIFILIGGCVLIPMGRERKFQFGITFFQDYCHSYVLEALYLLGYPVSAYVFVRLSHGLWYFVSHVKFKLYTILDITKDISAEYDNHSDNDLIDCDEYQKIVKARLLVIVTELTELSR